MPLLERDEELALIDEQSRKWGTRCIVCISAPGGFGKTRLLEEIQQRYAQADNPAVPLPAVPLIVTDIIDFDDRTFHIPQIVGRKIADMLDIQVFDPYLRGLVDVRSMEVAGYSSDVLLEQGLAVEQTFVSCFNQISARQRVVVLMDTSDALESQNTWIDIARMLLQTSNILLLLAGRNARAIGESLQLSPDDIVNIIDLPPLSPTACETYLRHRQQMRDVVLDPQTIQPLLWLAGGKLLLLDVVVEWQRQGVVMNWLPSYRLEALQDLGESQQHSTRQQFEQQLLTHVTELGEGVDWLFLVMACVYPLDRETIGKLLGLSPDEADALFVQAQQYTFVKNVSDTSISLHDEMRWMINEYVWGEIDPEGDPQRRASRIAAEYLEREIQALTDKIAALQHAQNQAKAAGSDEAVLQGFMALEPLEQELWSLKSQLLDHTVLIDLDGGIETFADLFDEATRAYRFSFRGPLLNSVQPHLERLSSEQQYSFLSRQARYFFDESEYNLTCSLVTEILERDDILPQQQIDMRIQRANAEIRLGNVEKGIDDFRAAVAISEENQLLPLIIRTKNALGWAHRLVGELDLATRYYREAQALCLEQGTLGDDYGWILNNLTFVLSRQNHRSAIGYGRSAVTYWRTIGNDIGLGACYLVLGMAYYQGGFYTAALDVLEKSLLIFEPLQLQNWMAQIYSWRGAVYLELKDLTRAEEELLGSLDIGARNIEPVTLNHLGKLYVAQNRWELAGRYFQRSHQRSQEIPDFISWITSLAGLATVAAAQQQYDQRPVLEQHVQHFLARIKTPDGKALGIAQSGLARLALDQGDLDAAIHLLEQGITLLAAHDSFLQTDFLNQLTLIEQSFGQIDSATVRQIGQTLQERFQQKEADDIIYGMVTPVMYRWAHWKEQTG